MLFCSRCGARYLDVRLRACPVDGTELRAWPEESPPPSSSLAERSLRAGEMVGEYQIEARIGEGGFGVVYRAVQPLIGKQVAVKVLSRHYASGDELVERFVTEARAVNRIRHRNIIDIFSFGVLPDGRHYYVMELLEGETLDALLGRVGTLSPELAIELLRPVARALDAAHGAGIAHRDLKPENIFLAIDRDEEVYPKLLDFGIAKLFTGSAAAAKTGGGVPLGTPHYMSPEQCRGRNVDQRTDIYSFGVLTFRALTGRLPFEGDEVMGVMMAQVSSPPPRPSSICSTLPPSVDGPLLQMLAKSPDRRPASILMAVEALASACGLTPTGPGSFLPSSGFGPPSLVPPSLPPPSLSPGSLPSPSLSPGSSPPPRPSPGSLPPPRPSQGSLPPSLSPGSLPPPRPSPQGSWGEPPSNIALLSVPAVAGRGVPLWASGPEAAARRTSFALGALALVAIGGGGFWLGRRGGPVAAPVAAIEAPASRGEASAGRAEVIAPLQGADAPKAPTAPTGEAAPSTSVRVRVRATPPAEVYWGDRRLGSSEGGPIELPRGAAPIKLILRAEGYRSTELDVSPDADRELSAALVKRPPPSQAAPATLPPPQAVPTASSSARARPPVSRDLENPFD